MSLYCYFRLWKHRFDPQSFLDFLHSEHKLICSIFGSGSICCTCDIAGQMQDISPFWLHGCFHNCCNYEFAVRQTCLAWVWEYKMVSFLPFVEHCPHLPSCVWSSKCFSVLICQFMYLTYFNSLCQCQLIVSQQEFSHSIIKYPTHKSIPYQFFL